MDILKFLRERGAAEGEEPKDEQPEKEGKPSGMGIIDFLRTSTVSPGAEEEEGEEEEGEEGEAKREKLDVLGYLRKAEGENEDKQEKRQTLLSYFGEGGRGGGTRRSIVVGSHFDSTFARRRLDIDGYECVRLCNRNV